MVARTSHRTSHRARAMLPDLPEVSAASISMMKNKKAYSRERLVTLDQLQQNATRARRMHKHIAVSAGSGLDLIGDQAHAVFFQPLDCRGKIRNAQAHVMQAFAALGQKLRDGGR